METVVTNLPHYDLSDYRYQRAQITLANNKTLNGQFVQFSVVQGIVETFPAVSQLCFLPAANEKEFWDFYNANNGVFPELPKYILMFKPSDILRIVIEPVGS